MRKGFTLVELLVILAVIGTIGGIFFQPLFERNSFNKFSNGPKATYWDAMFSELRIEANRVNK